MQRLETSDVPFAPVNDTAEVLADAQVQHLGLIATAEHPTEGKVTGIRSPVLFDGARGGIEPAPSFGEHTRSVLAGLGYSAEEIEGLAKAGVI